MAIKGKKLYKVYLDEEETEFLKTFLDSTRGKGGLSGLLNTVVVNTAATIREAGIKPDASNFTWAKLIRMVLIGAKKEV